MHSKDKSSSRQSLLLPFLMIAFFTLTLVLPLIRGASPIRFGLDLSGGVIVTYRPDVTSRLAAFDDVPEDEILQQVKDTLGSRLQRRLATVPDVVIRDDQRIAVSLPGRQDYQRVLEIVGKTYNLTFRLVEARHETHRPDLELFADRGSYLELAPAEFSGEMLDERYLRVETEGSLGVGQLPQALVSFRFAAPHDEAFAAFTRANVGRELAILLDDEVEWAGTIESPILGSGVLRGGYGVEQANEIATMLRSGSLPISLEFESLTSVGPSLGEEVRELGWRALLLALGLLATLVTLAYWHRAALLTRGLLALSCLLLSIAGLASLFGLTLDVVGIAGLILSIGMGMDAFILIFEALDAEIRAAGAQKLKGRCAALVRRLYSFGAEGGTLLHANATTLIVILLLLTSERLRSFALFMGVGILASLLTIAATRALLQRTGGLLRQRRPNLLAGLRYPRLGLFRLRRFYAAAVVVAVLLTGGLLAADRPGGPALQLGADFQPGLQVTLAKADLRRVEAALDDLESRHPELDARLQQLGAAEAGRYLVTLSATLDVPQAGASGAAEDPGAAEAPGAAGTSANLGPTFRPSELEAAFDRHALELESLRSIDSKVSFERLVGGLSVLLASFVFLAIYLVVLQEPIDRFLIGRRRPRTTSSTRLLGFLGILSAVVVDIVLMLMAIALLRLPISLPVLAAMLTIIGYSINDSVVLWNHVRKQRRADHGRRVDRALALEQVSRGVDRVASRACLTSLSTLVPAATILAVDLAPLADFALVMLVGTLAGTLSSLFIVGSFAVRALQEPGPVGRRVPRAAPTPRGRRGSPSPRVV